MNETFPHYYDDGYVYTNQVTSGWPIVFYVGLYNRSHSMPLEWNKHLKKSKPVAIFVTSQWRTNIFESKNEWYGCDVLYKFSAN